MKTTTIGYSAAGLLALLALPAIAEAQCNYERFGALTAGLNQKFQFMGSTLMTWANVDPVADGLTVDLDGTPVAMPNGSWGGAGTVGWIQLGDNTWVLKDSDGTDPKYKGRLQNNDGEVTFKVGIGKTSLGFLTGAVGENDTPVIGIDTNGQGCSTDFLNDTVDRIQDCRHKPGADPTKIKCRDAD